jgi:hypothetical protein
MDYVVLRLAYQVTENDQGIERQTAQMNHPLQTIIEQA